MIKISFFYRTEDSFQVNQVRLGCTMYNVHIIVSEWSLLAEKQIILNI